MPSLFPGVDPFLEGQDFWPDFHATFINYWREAVSEKLPDDYEARIDERFQLVAADDAPRQVKPDVSVIHRPNSQRNPEPAFSPTAMLEPVTIPLVMHEETPENFIKVFYRPERSLVAVLELLSPTNKSNPGRMEYLTRKRDLLRQQVHLVELDLLLNGQRLPLRDPLPPANFYAIVSRWDRRPDCDVYGWSLPRPLPTIPIPLRPTDGAVTVDLQQVFSLAYERGRYRKSIDYAQAAALPFDDSVLQSIRAMLDETAKR